MKGIVDRFEGNFAVVELEGKIMKNIELSVLPPGVKEGDLLIFVDGKWQHDESGTQKRQAEMKKKITRLFE